MKNFEEEKEKKKSILDLTLHELEEIIETNQLPEGVTLDRLEERRDFQALFSHRNNPKYIAKKLLKERITGEESLNLKERRLRLKELELSLKQKNFTSFGQELKDIKRLLLEIKGLIKLLLSSFEEERKERR